MSAVPELQDLADRAMAKERTRADRNRRDFPFVAEWLDVLSAAGIPAKVQYATNWTREVGERFEDRCRREAHVPCLYLPNGAPSEKETMK